MRVLTVTCQEHLFLKETRHRDSGHLWKPVRQVVGTLGPIMYKKSQWSAVL